MKNNSYEAIFHVAKPPGDVFTYLNDGNRLVTIT